MFAGVCSNGEVRLVDGDSYKSGRVEVCSGALYGTVCDDIWDLRDANIACQQSGFPGGIFCVPA